MVSIVGAILLCGLVLASAAEPKEEEDVLKDLQRFTQLRALGFEFADFFKNASLRDLSVPEPHLTTQQDLLCLKEMANFAMALSAGEFWALKMIDSWGYLPSGILTGNFYDFGNYDECLNIHKEISDGNVIRGKYCFLSVAPGQLLGIQTGVAAAVSVKTATCFPASCSASHMNQFLEQMAQRILNLNISNTGMEIRDSTCQTAEAEPLDGLTIFTIVILSLMLSAVALFTLYDYFLCRNQETMPTIVKVFSARVNSRSLFRIVPNNSNPNVIECLHGIRCMSLFWVVYCHEFAMMAMSANINLFSVRTWAEQPGSSFVLHGFFSVDSFFFLGGLLVTLLSLRMMEKYGPYSSSSKTIFNNNLSYRTKGKLNVPLMYLHRFIRLLPIVAIAILVSCKIMPLVADGPLFASGYSGKEACANGWYWSLLFVQNYMEEICLAHTWYLAVDMQLFIISPILLIALYKWGKKAAGGVFILMLLLSACLFATQMVNNWHMLLQASESNDAMRKLYLATHTHAAPWLIGFLFGYFLHLIRGQKIQLSKLAAWSGWILCLALIFTSIFALYPAGKWDAEPLSVGADAAYYTLTRIAWPLALCWVVFACMQGYGGMANSFLSSPLWQPLSRLSYSVYIWHMFVQEINVRRSRTNSYFSDYQVMLNFWSDIGLTIILAYVMYLIVESPVNGLDNFLKPKAKAPPVTNGKRNFDEVQQDQIEEKSPSKLEELKVTTPTSD
ncbi:hypothetical protein KR009_004983 [Drosophila setifemur]|nr:hypothetical protein KR009_004983 [Drosophila setifemur]